MKNGRVAVMIEPGKLVFSEYELPPVHPGDILVEVIRTNICGSELHIWKGHHPIKKTGVLGHEMVGRIARLGAGVETDFAGDPVSVGDRVASTYFLSCRKCGPCQQGLFYLCENAYRYWNMDADEAPHFHGSFGTHYYVHSEQYFYKVPENVPDVAAASANCALAQVYFGLEQAQLRMGESLVIQGAGGLGLNAVAVAREMGAHVIVIDGVQSRLEQARKFGAEVIIDLNEHDSPEKRVDAVKKATRGKGADVGMELTGVPPAFAEGIHLVRPGARYVSIGNISPGQLTAFDPGLLTRKAVQIIPVVRYQPWYLKKALDFLANTIDRYPFAEILDCTYRLDDVMRALDESFERKVTRASISMGGGSDDK